MKKENSIDDKFFNISDIFWIGIILLVFSAIIGPFYIQYLESSISEFQNVISDKELKLNGINTNLELADRKIAIARNYMNTIILLNEMNSSEENMMESITQSKAHYVQAIEIMYSTVTQQKVTKEMFFEWLQLDFPNKIVEVSNSYRGQVITMHNNILQEINNLDSKKMNLVSWKEYFQLLILH